MFVCVYVCLYVRLCVNNLVDTLYPFNATTNEVNFWYVCTILEQGLCNSGAFVDVSDQGQRSLISNTYFTTDDLLDSRI